MEGIVVSPNPVIFRNGSPGRTDQCEVIVRNTNRKPVRLRFFADHPFELSTGRTFMVVPGLEARVFIKYIAQSSDMVESHLRVSTSEGEIIVPIKAYPVSAIFEFNQKLLDFRTVGTGSSTVQQFYFRNFGQAPANFKFTWIEPSVVIQPERGVVKPNEEFSAFLTFKPLASKKYDFEISAVVEGSRDPIIPMRVQANVVPQALEMLLDGKPFQELDFGYVFFGHRRVFNVLLKNTGTCRRAFTFAKWNDVVTSGRGRRGVAQRLRTNSEDDMRMEEAFRIKPSSGEIDANSSLNIEISFDPPRKGESRGIEIPFSSSSALAVAETEQKVQFVARGIATEMKYSITGFDFDFGRQKVATKETLICRIENNSTKLPLTFSFTTLAHFSFQPQAGKVEASSYKDISICFFPQRLGPFDMKSRLNICDGLVDRDVNLKGFATTTVDEKPFVRRPLVETDASARAQLLWPTSKYGLTVEEYNDKKAKREVADSYIKESARLRQEKREKDELLAKCKRSAVAQLNQTEQKYTNEDLKELVMEKLNEVMNKEDRIGLGFEPCEGLTPPDPPMRRIKEPLQAFRKTARWNKKAEFDDRVTIKKKFKREPASRAERTDCAKKLNPTQLLLVASSHQTMDFGRVSVGSREVRSFQITNNLSQFIHAKMIVAVDELRESTPEKQVIPPNQVAGFDMIFTPKKLGTVNTSFQYTINNSQTYSVAVVAEVIPIDVQLSRSSIAFSFGPDVEDNILVQKLTLSNTSNAPARYEWRGFDNVFYVHNNTGSIEPNREVTIDVFYKPDSNPHREAAVNFLVENGVSKTLKLVGDAGRPKIVLNKNRVDFGFLSMGTQVRQTITLKNVSQDDGVFTMVPCFTDSFTITPSKGRIPGGQSFEVEIAVKCDKPGSFDVPIRLFVCGGTPLQFSVAGYAEFPKVELICGSLDFGKVFRGSRGSREFSIKNTGGIPALVLLDFGKQNQFNIEYDEKLPPSVKVTSLTDARFFGLDTSSDVSSVSSGLSCSSSVASIESIGMIYQIEIGKGAAFEGNLIYQATEIGKSSFRFPIALSSVPEYEEQEHPLVSIDVVDAPLFPSAMSIEFGVQTLIDPLNPNNIPKTKTLTVRNGSTSGVSYRIENKSSAFVVENPTGKIGFSSFASVFIHFKPTEPVPYVGILSLYVVTEMGENFIADIELSGVGTSRKFFTSVNHLTLPIVPLGVRSEGTVMLINTGAIPAELEWTLPVSTKQFPIEFEFPEGNTMIVSTQQLPIKVSFMSERPMNFTVLAGIVDKNGNSASFYITGITDNSVFTLHSLLSMNSYKVSAGQGKPITAKLAEGGISRDFLGDVLAINDFKGIKPRSFRSTVNPLMIGFLSKFLATVVLHRDQPIQFPREFVKSDGQLLIDIINSLSGQKIALSGSKDLKGTARHLTKYETMKSLLQLLKTSGAMVAEIKPEFLLGKRDYSEFMKEKIKMQLLGLDYYGAPDISTFKAKDIAAFTSRQSYNKQVMSRLKVAEALHKMISLESWTMIVLQVLKLHLMGKGDFEHFEQIPGVSDALTYIKSMTDDSLFVEINRPNRSLSQSNLFSSAECLLLKWVSIHYCRMNGGNAPVVTDFLQLRNPVLLGCVFQSHMTNRAFNVAVNPVTLEDRQQNLSTLIEMFKVMRSPIVPTTMDVMTGDHVSLAIMSQYLMRTLPHFIPSANINFLAPLSETTSQIVAVQNPSNQRISYRGIIEGSQNFKLRTEEFSVEPNKTFNLVVEYFAKSHGSEKATLTLIPCESVEMRVIEPQKQRSGRESVRRNIQRSRQQTTTSDKQKGNSTAVASTMVVELVAKVLVRTPLKTIRATGVLYDHTSFKIDIPNVIQAPGEYDILYKMFPIADANDQDFRLREQQMNEFIEGATGSEVNSEISDGENDFYSICKSYCPFLFRQTAIKFDDSDSIVTVSAEFIPITLRKVRCLVLVCNADLGEMMLEIIGEPEMIKPASCGLHFKLEAKQKTESWLPLETRNQALFHAIGYSRAREETMDIYVSEAKMAELVNQHAHVIQSAYTQSFSSTQFAVTLSAPTYFDAPKELTICKKTMLAQGAGNGVSVSFHPTDPGTYPCSIALVSEFDVRAFSFVGEALPETRNLQLEMITISGKEVVQELPFANPSDEIWRFKVTVEGDTGFSVENSFIAKPQSVYKLRLSFVGGELGENKATLTIKNITKEAIIIYKVVAVVEDPPAEESFSIKCKARDPVIYHIPIERYVDNGVYEITSTCPLITFPNTITIAEGIADKALDLEVFASRSGVTMGALTVKEVTKRTYVWFVVNIEVERPTPEEIIDVSTISRKTATITMPVKNPRNYGVTFDVSFDSPDFFGDKKFTIQANSTSIYSCVFSPLKAMNGVSYVSFYNEDEGEFVYQLNLDVAPPDLCTIAQMSAPIGSVTSTTLLLDNPLSQTVSFKVSNENPICFQLSCRNIVTLEPLEKKRIEVKYVPSSIGNCETSYISFTSRAAGELNFKVSGIGKPPQPLSPVFVEAMMQLSQSGAIVFRNPFTYQVKFEARLVSSDTGIFSLLSKHHIFTLSEFKEEHQVAFSFSPKEPLQYTATIIISTIGLENEISWSYPLIGNTLIDNAWKVPTLKGKAGSVLFHKMVFALIGERETFELSDYKVSLEYPKGYEWMESMVTILPLEEAPGDTRSVRVTVKFQPRKPVRTTLGIVLENPIHQKWRFHFDAVIERGRVTRIVGIESPLNVATARRIKIGESIQHRMEYRAYFEAGSANELTVVPSSGVLELSLRKEAEFPFEVVFQPRMYGKMMKGLLVVETEEIEFLFEVHGKIPDYVPPNIERSGRIDMSTPEGARKKIRTRRNFIRENIERVRQSNNNGDSLRRKMKVTRVQRTRPIEY